MNNKEFDRSVCFTFFEDYRITSQSIQEDFGKEAVADYYNAIIDYALYAIEPEVKGAIKYVWPTTKTTIDTSINRRSQGFAKENIEQTKAIIKYREDHPDATQREIATACSCSIGKVNKTLRDNLSDNSIPNSIPNTDSNTSSNTTVNMNVNNYDSQCEKEGVKAIEDLTEEAAEEIIRKIKRKEKYTDIQKEYNLEYGSVTKDFEKQWREFQVQKQHKKEQLDLKLNQEKYIYLQECWELNSINETVQRINSFLNKYPWTIDEVIGALQQNDDFNFNTYKVTVSKKRAYDWTEERYNEVPSVTYPEWLNSRMRDFYKKDSVAIN